MVVSLNSRLGRNKEEEEEIKSQVRNPDLESATLSAGNSLCPYGIADHQQPDVNYIQVLEKVDFPCTVNAQH